jgi:ribosomal protein L40E
MQICSTCGKKIPDDARKCRSCDSYQQPGASLRGTGKEKIKTINLKKGLPLVDEALDVLCRELELARSQDVEVLRIIHGYGSSGTGGKIKRAVLQELAALYRAKGVRAYLVGDEYSENTRGGQDLLKQFPGLESTLVSDRHNPGITFVQL